MQALAIINLSSLDAYTNAYGEEKGAQLAHTIYEKIDSFNGPVYVIDQRWILTEDSRPRLALLRSLNPLMLRKDIQLVEFEEAHEEWEYFLKAFRDTLKKDGVTSVVLGGLWYDPESEAGAVGDAKRFLSQAMYSMVDKKITAAIPKNVMQGRRWRI